MKLTKQQIDAAARGYIATLQSAANIEQAAGLPSGSTEIEKRAVKQMREVLREQGFAGSDATRHVEKILARARDIVDERIRLAEMPAEGSA